MITIVKQLWIESEAGWGIRPDGYSLHLTVEDRNSFIKNYWKDMPDETPQEYSRPEGGAKPHSIDELSPEYLKLRKAKYGIRIFA